MNSCAHSLTRVLILQRAHVPGMVVSNSQITSCATEMPTVTFYSAVRHERKEVPAEVHKTTA